MTRRSVVLTTLAVAAFFRAGVLVAEDKAPDVMRPSFSGKWTLDPEVSDDARAKM